MSYKTINIRSFRVGDNYYRLDLDSSVDSTFVRDEDGKTILKFCPNTFASLPDGTVVGKCRLRLNEAGTESDWHFEEVDGFPKVAGAHKNLYDLEALVGGAFAEREVADTTPQLISHN